MAKFDETCINSGSITMNDYRRLVSCAASHHTVQVRWFCVVMQLLFWPETTSMFTLPCKDSIFSTITMDYMTAHERESCSLSQLCLRWLTAFFTEDSKASQVNHAACREVNYDAMISWTFWVYCLKKVCIMSKLNVIHIFFRSV